MIIGDFNEFHFITDANAYKNQKESDGSDHPIAILRASYSNSHEDLQYGNQVRICRAAGILLGHYGYLIPTVDARAQGEFFASIIKKYGGIQPGEPIYCDAEDQGDLESSVMAFLAGAHSILDDTPADEGVYSGAAFYAANLGSTPAGVHKWIAAYGQSKPPPLGEDEWQFTDNHPFAGCNLSTADGSIYNGTLETFKALFGFNNPPPGPIPQPQPSPAPTPQPAIPAYPGRLFVYRPGQVMTHGADVLEWQRQMQRRTWSIGTPSSLYGMCDSFYGGKSAKLCKAFEADQHLPEERGAYGIVGPQVWHATWANPVTR